MTGRRQAALRQMLEDLKRETLVKLRARATPVVDPTEVMDSVDRGAEESMQDMELILAERDGETLHGIEEALVSLQSGHYGICSVCGAEIAEVRLKALPFATLCHTCQSGQEADREPSPGARRVGAAQSGPVASKHAGRRSPRRGAAPTPDEIAQRAHEIYLSRGAVDGKALTDWLQAERELREDDGGEGSGGKKGA